MVLEYGGEVAAQLSDLCIADIGVEDLFQHGQLLRTNQLLIIQETPVLDNCSADHVLYLAEYLGANVGRFHSKITSRCLHWKRTYINVAFFKELKRDSNFRMENSGSAGQVSVFSPQFQLLLAGEMIFAKSLFKGFISVVF
jgi:hypothetical protein